MLLEGVSGIAERRRGILVRHGRAGFNRDAANQAGAEIMELKLRRPPSAP